MVMTRIFKILLILPFEILNKIRRTINSYKQGIVSYSSGDQHLYHKNLISYLNEKIEFSKIEEVFNSLICEELKINELPISLRIKLVNDGKINISSYLQDRLKQHTVCI